MAAEENELLMNTGHSKSVTGGTGLFNGGKWQVVGCQDCLARFNHPGLAEQKMIITFAKLKSFGNNTVC